MRKLKKMKKNEEKNDAFAVDDDGTQADTNKTGARAQKKKQGGTTGVRRAPTGPQTGVRSRPTVAVQTRRVR